MSTGCPVNVRIPPELKARVKRLAKLNGIRRCDFIRLCICSQLDDLEQARIQPEKPCERQTGRRRSNTL